MSGFTSVAKSAIKNGNPGRPNPKSSYIILIKAKEVSGMPSTNGVVCTEELQLKVGKTAIEIYATPNTIKVGDKSSGEPDKKGFIQTLEFEHPGSSDEYAAFANNNVNESLMAIVVYPDLANNKLLGSVGNPLQLNHEQKDDEKEDTNIIKFESLFAGEKTLHYPNTLSLPTTDLGAGSYNDGSGA